MGRSLLAFSGWARRLKEAAIWRVRAEQDAAVEKDAKFRKWIGEAPNGAAWDTVGHLWEVLDHHRDAPELLVLRKSARSRAHFPFSFVRKPIWRYATGATALAFVIAVSVIRISPAPKPVNYSTAVGQRQIVALADGSCITLDSSSSITVTQLSGKVRNLVLNRGRAHFEVAHDPSRPFRVSVGNRMVIAVGTAFNIERLEAKILVTLTQGRVNVESEGTTGSAPNNTVRLTSGQELVLSQAGAPAIRQIDPLAANAWERGQIVLNDEPLDEVAERLNRYLTTPLLVDPAIAKMRISGVFNVGKLNSFVGALTSYFPIQSRTENGHILLEKRA
jgi:transmembrane sensor